MPIYARAPVKCCVLCKCQQILHLLFVVANNNIYCKGYSVAMSLFMNACCNLFIIAANINIAFCLTVADPRLDLNPLGGVHMLPFGEGIN